MRGRITDAQTGEGVSFAYITNAARGQRGLTVQADEDGNWTGSFAPGEMLRFAQVGYQPMTAQAADPGGIMLVQMQPAGDLDPVIIERERPTGWVWLLLIGVVLIGANSRKR